MLFEL